MSAADPFYLVKEEIQDSVDKVQDKFFRWKALSAGSEEHIALHRELISACDSLEWQVDELNRAIAMAEQDPARFGIDNAEIGKRKKWTNSTKEQITSTRKTLRGGLDKNNDMQNQTKRRESTRMQDGPGPKPNRAIVDENDDFVYSESDRQALIIKEQDQELDELSASVVRLGGLGITIHEELNHQDVILEELSRDMDSTANRLDFVQKKMAHVIRKAGIKGQLMLIVFLVVLLLILVYLVFFT